MTQICRTKLIVFKNVSIESVLQTPELFFRTEIALIEIAEQCRPNPQK